MSASPTDGDGRSLPGRFNCERRAGTAPGSEPARNAKSVRFVLAKARAELRKQSDADRVQRIALAQRNVQGWSEPSRGNRPLKR